MPGFTIHTVNSSFHTEADLPDVHNPEDALRSGLRGAIMIAADEVQNGATASVVEVIVEDAEGRHILRSAVCVSVASLAVEAG